MISATTPVQWDDLTGLNTNKGVRERLHEQLDIWRDMLEKAAASLAAEVPYDKAEELFKELTGVSMSDHTMHEVLGDICEDFDVLTFKIDDHFDASNIEASMFFSNVFRFFPIVVFISTIQVVAI